MRVVNVIQRQKNSATLFFVDLRKDDNSKNIFNITYILHTKIKIEEPHIRSELVQYQNCQDYGHARSYCNPTIHAASDAVKITFYPPTTRQMRFHSPAYCAKRAILLTTEAAKFTSNSTK